MTTQTTSIRLLAQLSCDGADRVDSQTQMASMHKRTSLCRVFAPNNSGDCQANTPNTLYIQMEH